MKKIKDTSKGLARIKDAAKPMRRLKPQGIAESLGAQKSIRLEVGGSPISAKASRRLAAMRNKAAQEDIDASEEVLTGSQK